MFQGRPMSSLPTRRLALESGVHHNYQGNRMNEQHTVRTVYMQEHA